ncbi:MAG: hypothetical protein ACTHMS_16370 [Jatrophihabitans sp.]|uniref:hypothetical protein n=1 Tax=Jatrophihabitans sp. TaxID=1932789 RepID=UPI003F7F202B
MPALKSKLAAVGVTLTAASLIATGCSSSGGGSNASGGSGTTSQAAQLRADLTGLLNDHVWLAGNALDTALHHGGNLKNPQVAGAVKALDDNSVDLSKAIGAAYPSAEKPFLASWRQHIGFFVNYTLGKATHKPGMVAKARKDLDGYRTAFGQLIHSVVPDLPADAVAKELVPHVSSLLAAIDADVAGKRNYQSLLAAAASHMTMTADVLAGAIAKNKKLSGDADSQASGVLATLTAQLNDHVWLAGNALDTAVREGGILKKPDVAGAVAALDGNSVAISKTVGSVYPSAEQPFLASWRQHIGFFVNYTLGKATKNKAMVAKATKDLSGYAQSFDQLLDSVIKTLPKGAVDSELQAHVSSLFAAIDASVAGAPDYQSKLAAAAMHMPHTAAALAGAIAADKKLT